MKFKLLLFLVLFVGALHAQQVRIGVYRDYKISRISFAYDKGSYSVYGDSTYFGSILPDEFVELSVVGNKVRLKIGVVEKGQFEHVHLVQNNHGSSIHLNPRVPNLKQRKYKDDFEVFSNGTHLTIVNVVDIDHYLAGVVESEGGGGKHLEYYKVQALMSRTYLMKYLNRHAKEGFSLCDRVHCQAYHSMMRFTPRIDEAVKQTQSIVMVDERHHLIESYFHANCGGQTCEPDYVWNNPIPYLRTFKDTFCIYTKQAKWEKKIPKQSWRHFLVTTYGFPIHNPGLAELMYSFDQPERKAFYIHPSLGIPLRDLRRKFKLKSTFFSCYPEGDYVVVQGRGFGHGVGLCQEGAMKMAKSGYTYDQIARFYFPGITIVDLSKQNFFNQDDSTDIDQFD